MFYASVYEKPDNNGHYDDFIKNVRFVYNYQIESAFFLEANKFLYDLNK